MMTSQVYLYSPFSPSDFSEKNNQVLLLLFILKELADAPHGKAGEPSSSLFAPFDWTLKGSRSQKLREHFSLLPFAFPELTSLVPSLYQKLESSKEELFLLLQPFIMACHTDENLLLFLIQHQNELAVKPLLDTISPEGMDALKEKIASRFRKRGYSFTRWIHSSTTP